MIAELRPRPAREDDLIQPFLIVATGVRGRVVRLGNVVDEVLSRHDYPEPVAVMLGEALALAATLAGALKFDGVLTLQTKGDGPISMLVADMTSDGDMRGYAQFDSSRLSQGAANKAARTDSVPDLLGQGYLAFTVDQGANTERYQGIVRLEGKSLAACAEHYFAQSEQIEAALRIAAGRIDYADGSSAWRAAGLMIQRLPDEGGIAGQRTIDPDAWNRTHILMESVTDAELLDPALAPNDVLYRLFHEDGVRVYEPAALQARCRCSRQRVGTVLTAIGRDDLAELEVGGVIMVTCEFCGRDYRFSESDLDFPDVR